MPTIGEIASFIPESINTDPPPLENHSDKRLPCTSCWGFVATALLNSFCSARFFFFCKHQPNTQTHPTASSCHNCDCESDSVLKTSNKGFTMNGDRTWTGNGTSRSCSIWECYYRYLVTNKFCCEKRNFCLLFYFERCTVLSEQCKLCQNCFEDDLVDGKRAPSSLRWLTIFIVMQFHDG